MTANEAIKILEVAKAECEWNAPLDYQEAFDLAISALREQDLQPSCNQLATDTVSRQAAIDELYKMLHDCFWADDEELDAVITTLNNLPSAQPDDDRLERCRFEYVNACKILAHRTPDTRKKDIDDAYAVVKALHPIFGDEEF